MTTRYNTAELLSNTFGLAELPSHFIACQYTNQDYDIYDLFAMIASSKELNQQFQELTLNEEGTVLFDTPTMARFYVVQGSKEGERDVLVREHFTWTKAPDGTTPEEEIAKVRDGVVSDCIESVFHIKYDARTLDLLEVYNNQPGTAGYTDKRIELDNGFEIHRFDLEGNKIDIPFSENQTVRLVGEVEITTSIQDNAGEAIIVTTHEQNDEILKRIVTMGDTQHVTKYNGAGNPFLVETAVSRTVYLYDELDRLVSFVRTNIGGGTEVATAAYVRTDDKNEDESMTLTVYDKGIPHRSFDIDLLVNK